MANVKFIDDIKKCTSIHSILIDQSKVIDCEIDFIIIIVIELGIFFCYHQNQYLFPSINDFRFEFLQANDFHWIFHVNFAEIYDTFMNKLQSMCVFFLSQIVLFRPRKRFLDFLGLLCFSAHLANVVNFF